MARRGPLPRTGALLILTAALFVLAACGGGTKDPPPTGDALALEMRDVVLQDAAMQAMIGSRRPNEEYWLDASPVDPSHGERGGVVRIIFAKPVSFDGALVTGTDPCLGHGEEMNAEAACLDDGRAFTIAHGQFSDAQVLSAAVDIVDKRVYNVQVERLDANSVLQVIERLTSASE